MPVPFGLSDTFFAKVSQSYRHPTTEPMKIIQARATGASPRHRMTFPVSAVARAPGPKLVSQGAAVNSMRKKLCEIIRWNANEDGAFSQAAGVTKLQRLGYHNFSETLELNMKGSVGSKFPFHAHGDASLEMQVAGSSRYFFPNQDSVDIHEGDIVDCPKGKDGAHSVESLTERQSVLVANREVVFDDMVIAIFDNEGIDKVNYSETINGAILEDRIRAASVGSDC